MKQAFCEIKDHKDNPLNLVCTFPNCQKQGLICSFCLINNHNDHVKSCVSLKDILKSLNKVNNPKTREELGFIGCDILKQHNQIIQSFRKNIKEIKERINQVEQAIEKQMKSLMIEADLFVGSALENSLDKINSEQIKQQELNDEIIKLLPLLSLQPDGSIEALGQEEKTKTALRVKKMAEVLERETKFWMEKSLEDLKNLEKSINKAQNKKLQSKISENRFGQIYEGWSLKEIDSICFEHKNLEEIWLTGFCMYKITKFPQNGQVTLHTIIRQGKSLEEKILYEQEFVITQQTPFGDDYLINLNFSKALKMEPGDLYNISIKPNESCISFYGVNGCCETKDFKFKETVFPNNVRSNSTGIVYGMFPKFLFEE